ATGINEVKNDGFISGIIFNTSELNIHFVEQPKNKIIIQLSDVTGKIVYHTTSELKEKFIAIKTPSLTAGAYLLQVSDGVHSATKKLILSK
ncbi:MAG: T9SS type A sorting domain-containing protein, partial [Bacteroidia bacterium]|nr:T9SS type A sorting domain-containing protein [Bacteroidia bacterium]